MEIEEKKEIADSSSFVYEGDFKSGIPDGQVRINYPDGDIYEGKWEGGEEELGTFEYANGDV
jgi:hypothetical protein